MQPPSPLVVLSTIRAFLCLNQNCCFEFLLLFFRGEREELDQEDALGQFSSGAALKAEQFSVRHFYIHI